MTFRIIFDGETMPGFDQASVIRNATSQLGMNQTQAEALFSGKPVLIKRGLTVEKLSRYLDVLAKAGLRVRTEAEEEPVAAVPPTPTPAAPSAPASRGLSLEPIASPPPPPVAQEQFVEEITCPRCKEVQPKRTLCRNCSLDIPRYLAAQQGVGAAFSDRGANARSNPQTISHTASHTSSISHDDHVALLGLSFEGRMRRRTYVASTYLAMLLLFGVIGACAELKAPLLMLVMGGITGLAAFVLSMRAIVMRCHDMGWSGWLSLLTFVPLVSLIFHLLLLFMPGSPDDNEYGEHPYSTSWGKVLLIIFAFFLSIILMAFAVARMTPPRPSPSAGYSMQEQPTSTAGQYHIIMYSLTDCGYCKEKREILNAEGVRFTEVFLDQDVQAESEFRGKLQRVGHHGGVGTPSFDINGKMLLNNPSMDEIHAAMSRSGT